ncbi:MAG: PLDc N-terminal domain-containing protein [Desulfobacterales bacterium]|nr:PLDc N-terminal domain-containing protein [Desulfobacterales bacterium]
MNVSNVSFMVIGIGLFFYLLTCAAVIDIAQKNFGSIGKKAGWGFVAMIPFIGPLIYFIFGFRKSIN